MKIKFLGTAAAEAFPAMFCDCENCKKARSLGGKNIRTRSQTLIDNDLFIDYPFKRGRYSDKRGLFAS